MIVGRVDQFRRPSISLLLIDEDGQEWPIEAHVDTGFSGELTLPAAAIERLGLGSSGFATYRLGDGSLLPFDSYDANIRWADDVRHVTALVSENFPLIGVGLLWGNNLSVDFRDGGDVSITELGDG